MAFRVTKVAGGFLLGACAAPAFACNLPTLPVIPAADQLGDRAPAVTAATNEYFEGIRAYGACIESELAAAGGDAAPQSVKEAFVARSTEAVAEAQAVQTLYLERVGSGQAATSAAEPALRKLIEGLAGGMPDYESMTADMQRVTRQQLGNLQRNTAALGAIQRINFRGIGARGWDNFEVHGENATLTALIHLDEAGKIDGAFLQPAQKPGERRPTATIPRRH